MSEMLLDLTEAQFQQRILDYCQWKNVHAFHSGDSRRDSSAGFPDLVLVGSNGIVFAELKTRTGRVSQAQDEWHDRLRVAGATCHLWRPADWEEVQHVINTIA